MLVVEYTKIFKGIFLVVSMSGKGRKVGEVLSLIGISYADYLDWRKSLDGCYELMRMMLDIPGFNIFDSVF